MIYETKSGARYTVVVWDAGEKPSWCIACKTKGKTKWRVSHSKAFRGLYSFPVSAETALKAYADAHPGWKVVEG